MVVYNLNPLYTWPLYAFFLLVDGAYLSANLFKFLTGEPFCSLPCNYHTGLPMGDYEDEICSVIHRKCFCIDVATCHLLGLALGLVVYHGQ